MKKIFFVFLLVSSLFSQWSASPENPVTAGNGVQPQLAALTDGSLYIAWLSESTFHVYLQLLDPAGIPQLTDGGLLISDHPNISWIAVFHLNLISDSEGNAILSFVDSRTGSWNVFAYKISPEGEFLWGDDGIQLSFTATANISPRLSLLSDNAVVVSWCEDFSVVHAQKITPDGVSEWNTGGIVISDPDASLVNPYSIVSDDGDILLRWIRQTGPYWAPVSELMMQKYDTGGNSVWPSSVSVSGETTFPMGNWLQQLISDGTNGSYSAWTIMTGNTQSAISQAVDPDGNTVWGSGIELSALAGQFRTNPVIAAAPNSHQMTAVWTQANGAQNQHGVYGQRLSADGSRLWGDSGIPVVSLNTQYDYLGLSMTSFDEDAVAVYIQQSGSFQSDLFALRLDSSGEFVWAPDIVRVTTSGNSKSDAAIQKGPGCLFIAWSESGTIRAHCLRSDGTLGAPVIEDECIPSGDVNNDGDLNILDIVTVVNFVLGQQLPTEYQQCAGDMNSDGDLNILDIVMMVNQIIGG